MTDAFRCPVRESGGARCERKDPHPADGKHWISDKTIKRRLR